MQLRFLLPYSTLLLRRLLPLLITTICWHTLMVAYLIPLATELHLQLTPPLYLIPLPQWILRQRCPLRILFYLMTYI